ncbi:MAG: SpoIIE family protein phosphatase [Chitinispirillaceae bacterium]|nr:SpoIIE family protein phosphatase [Chitinispirillaceae bacterium]
MDNISFFLMIFFIIIGVCLAIISLLYYRFPLHLIYRIKTDLQEVLDGIDDPIAVVSENFTVERANKAYIALVKRSFSEIIGKKCYMLFRGRSEPCKDCLLISALKEKKSFFVESTQHPSENGSLSIRFSPVNLSLHKKALFVIEHIRDITLTERLKIDLENRNRSLGKVVRELREAQRNIKEELRLARNIQRGILPGEAPNLPEVKIDHMYHPITEVGGDIYDFILYPSGRLGIFIGDASGHGLAAAFVGTISKMSLYHHIKTEIPPSELVTKINEDLVSNIHSGHYLTCFWGIFNMVEKTLTFCNAGHPVPIQIKKDGKMVGLSTTGTFIGILPNNTFEEKIVKFEKGDRFFLFTDGIYEAEMSPSKTSYEPLGYEGFISILASCKDLPFSRIIPYIKGKLSNYTYDDDYTLIAMEIV